VRRHEERHLRHDPLRQPRIRSEVGQRFECIDHATRLVNAGAAFRTLVEVRTKIGDAESGFAVDQQIDFIREQMTMIHVASCPNLRAAGVLGFRPGPRVSG